MLLYAGSGKSVYKHLITRYINIINSLYPYTGPDAVSIKMPPMILINTKTINDLKTRLKAEIEDVLNSGISQNKLAE
jgi:hypothetical protein